MRIIWRSRFRQIKAASTILLFTIYLILMVSQYWSIAPQTCQDICAALPPVLIEQTFHSIGNITMNIGELSNLTLDNVVRVTRPHVIGGSWAPRSKEQACVDISPTGLAIIIPIRDRWNHVPALLSELVSLLRNQQLCYRVFIVEQTSMDPFNRGALFNVGFIEARRRYSFRCVVLHDVDLIPINDDNPYGCDAESDTSVVLLSVALERWNFKLLYPKAVGGVLKMSTKHYVMVNGFSNQYWGWGAEDDDMESRLRAKHIPYKHMNSSTARYMSLSHTKASHSRLKHNVELYLNAKNRIDTDGLNSTDYKLLLVRETPLFTHYSVHLNNAPKS